MCMTWDDDFRMSKTVRVYRQFRLIIKSLKHFKDFLKLNYLSTEPMKLKGLLQIYLFSLVSLCEHYEADTKADKVVPHVMAHLGLVLHLLYFRVFFAMVRENLLITLLQKGLICTNVKEKF